MEAFSAQGTCDNCGSFTRSVGATGDDALVFLHHEHGHEHGHSFRGVVTVRTATAEEFASRGSPRRTRK